MQQSLPPSVTPAPAIASEGMTVRARLSHYWPALGGVNCFRFVAGECVSRMASGERWQDWIGRAVACPKEYPFWTRVILPGGEEFICLDRGGKIVDNWFDLLVQVAPVPFGTLVDVRVILPEAQ